MTLKSAKSAVRGAAVTLLMVAFGLPAAGPGAEPPDRAHAGDSVRRIAEAGMARTVGISCSKEKYETYFGTGAVVTADGYIVTSTTVVPPGADQIKVISDQAKVRDAKLVAADEKLECTLLKVDAKDLAFFPVAENLPRVGEPAYTFSNAFRAMNVGKRASFSMGMISGIYRVGNQGGESRYEGPAIETTAAINPGSDGGPIVNGSGQLCAVISLNVSPLRWEGVGVPIAEVLGRLQSLAKCELRLSHEPLVSEKPGQASPASWVDRAAEAAKYLVGISVVREFPPEVLRRIPWNEYRKGIAGWDKKSQEEKQSLQTAHSAVCGLLETNQMLRRPPGLLTGVVISADGFILTSDFNLGKDRVFKNKKTGKLPVIELAAGVQKLIGGVPAEFVQAENPIKQIQVTLADGSKQEARLVARNVPLGVALVKINTKNLPFLDMEKAAAPAKLGLRVGIVGFAGGALVPYTLNPGIVSSPSRDSGFHFQTDALINYGNSGGLVLTSDGGFAGIAAAPILPQTVMGRPFSGVELTAWQTVPNSGVGMVARADRLVAALADLKAGKTLDRDPAVRLGVVIDPSHALGERLIVGAVLPGSPAAKAGFKRGDCILDIDGVKLTAWKNLLEYLGQRHPGDKVEVKVQRKDIVRHLLVKNQKVETEADLQKLMSSLKPGEKFDGTLVQSDVTVIPVILGDKQ
jgi:S1-C subfamily serine protease